MNVGGGGGLNVDENIRNKSTYSQHSSREKRSKNHQKNGVNGPWQVLQVNCYFYHPCHLFHNSAKRIGQLQDLAPNFLNMLIFGNNGLDDNTHLVSCL